MNAKKPRTPSLSPPEEDFKRRCETDNTNATSLKGNSYGSSPNCVILFYWFLFPSTAYTA